MSKLLPRSQFPAGLDKGDYVALTAEEFRAGYDTFSAGIAGELPVDPAFPTEYQDGRTGEATPLPDTPFNRAWYAASKLFTDEAKRVSFGARLERVMPIALDRKYAKYVNRQAGSLHIALLLAVATVRFSSRTTAKALRSAFDMEVRRHVAATIDVDTTNATESGQRAAAG